MVQNSSNIQCNVIITVLGLVTLAYCLFVSVQGTAQDISEIPDTSITPYTIDAEITPIPTVAPKLYCDPEDLVDGGE